VASNQNPYLATEKRAGAEDQTSRGCFIVVCVLCGFFVSALVVSIWMASLIDYSEISSTNGANIGAGIAIVSLCLFSASVLAIVLIVAVFYAFNQKQPDQKDSARG